MAVVEGDHGGERVAVCLRVTLLVSLLLFNPDFVTLIETELVGTDCDWLPVEEGETLFEIVTDLDTVTCCAVLVSVGELVIEADLVCPEPEIELVGEQDSVSEVVSKTAVIEPVSDFVEE
eukprot:TRINITY_DN29661_c0_g1_i1.p2 TRINITY_DN29661_c0_g1~~TRINITY_DN29661_c0_g1_i1.p2  ORF type:complete len:120 (-),score=20.06 TRINITY_DN29661_c0_g1_i1:14-373(-)